MSQSNAKNNLDQRTVKAFGDQWKHYNQRKTSSEELQFLFDRYFSLVEWDQLPENAKGFDAGCGSGRWALLAAQKLNHLHCIDASVDALEVAKENLKDFSNCSFHSCSIEAANIDKNSLDFGYSLGVLHHMPDTQAALDSCVAYLKPGAPFLVYLYYNFDNQPKFYRLVWKVSEIIRKIVTALPVRFRNKFCAGIATIVYWPLAKISAIGEKIGFKVKSWPLSDYRHASFYRMRHNARDRFGTELEQRFSKIEITEMMEKAGLKDIKFKEGEPYWCALGHKAS